MALWVWRRVRVSEKLLPVLTDNLEGINTSREAPRWTQPWALDAGSCVVGRWALIKRRLENRAKRSGSSQAGALGLNKGSRHHGSRESVSIPISAFGSLDLSADSSTVIRPVHSSILGEKYCFEVISSENTHCFGCSSAAERDRWIEDLRRAAQPNKDNVERTENSLSLWVNEAKDLPAKRRYYCELHLDGTLFARTTSRAVGKPSHRSSLVGEATAGASGGLVAGGGAAGGCQLFWGELFELDNLPCISQITLHLFREEDPKKKRHSREEASFHPLGSVAIPLDEIRGRAYQEKWYPIIPYKAPASTGSKDLLGPQASLRIKARFQNLKVLPMEKYKEFAEYLTMDYVEMCRCLEPLLNVKEKEEMAGALVHMLQSIGKAKEFLIDLGGAEVERLGQKEALIFRENTLATKAIDDYMKLVGQKYLIDTLGDFINRLYASGENCEVDPRKCSAAELSNNQKHLMDACEEVSGSVKRAHEPVPWIKVSQNRESSERKAENEQLNVLDRHAQELSELRLGIEQVTERELDMAKRLEDFINQSQDQNALLQAEVRDLQNLLAAKEEQLASATFRLGVIEEEKEEDERKLSVAVAAAERMSVLEEQFARLLRDLEKLTEAYNAGHNNTQAS
ncbi:hypothetical protein fugu_008430 [Takifugu bimaculatus]|uniref:PH domain-containing protein n=1 Tax=Takifugu bimaculatus TaxID=433685 RepID=A0A4Z2B2X2_9TELE|nr:hypothetical protein fugu_008430 [Takifugu bimaculatus]